jgi:MFS family permease
MAFLRSRVAPSGITGSFDEVQPGFLLGRRATRFAFAGLMLASFLVALNQTIVATTVPAMAADLGGLDQYPWVFSAYLLSSSIAIPLSGRLSDIHGRRPFFILGLGLMIAGSVFGAAASTMGEVIAARAIQGLGGGAVLALVFTAIGDLVPPSRRGGWQAVNGAVFAAASVLGPLAGGWIADNTTWRWVFVVSIPIAMAALALCVATLRIPSHPDRGRHVDFAGAVMMVGALAGVMLATTEWGEGTSVAGAWVLVPLAIGVILVCAFVRHEKGLDDAFLPVEMLGDPVVRLACVAGVLTGAAHFGAITYVPLFATGALSASGTATGIALMGLMVSLFVATMTSGPAITRTGRYRWVILSAPPTIGLGYAGLALLGAGAPIAAATAATVVLGLGLGLVSQNLMLVAQNAAPSRHLGSTTAAVTGARNVGGALGIAVMGAVLAAGLPADARLPAPGRHSRLSADTFSDAFHPVFWAGAGLMVVTMLVVLRLPEQALRPTVRGDATTTAPKGLPS